ncbi:type IV secretory system conjugative DNA transfer family protein [Amycolatopsis samaneae]|uniref:Type IV secretory system conjugative DNA transfer family protein n=1 Tax=Amycolatopsis samaneae TaxID=664691 RepID=A0ABW5GTN4_9PSEU
MMELSWYNAVPPRDATLAGLTAMMRVLAGRPHHGLRQVQPLVVFEVWVQPERVRWLVGIEPRIARTLPGELVAQLPGLVLTPTATPERPAPITAREIRITSLVHPLRLDTAQAVTAGLVRLRDVVRSGEAVVVQFVVGPSQRATQVPIKQTTSEWLGFQPLRQPSGEEQRGWATRLKEPLLGVRGRIGGVAPNPRRAGELLRPAVSALGLASGSHSRVYASPQSSRTADQLTRVMGRVRSFSSIANASELAALSGWCLSGLDVAEAAGNFAPPPPSLLRPVTAGPPRGAARPLGVSPHPAAEGSAVWLPRSSYGTHVHLIAPTGAGKSTLLAHWVTAEAAAGGSLVVIEPRGDLVQDVLSRLPQSRHDDVVVIDPGADGPVTSFNPLAGPRDDAERRADSVLALLRELFGSAVGPRSGDVLLHALYLASRLDDGGLTDIPALLLNPSFRRSVAAKVSDPLTLAPWLAWFDNLSDPERAQVVQPVLNKVRPWTARPAIRRLLGATNPKFDLAQVFNRPTILLVNLNAGTIGPETTKLVGSLLLDQIWNLCQHQTTLPASSRRPVSVFADEWQTFTAGLDFADVLARSRGANVTWTLAHQDLGQLSTSLRAAVLANVGTRVAFRPAEGDGAALARVFGAPITPDDLERLGAFRAAARVLVNGAPSRTFEVVTPPLPDATADPDELRRTSAERYGIDPAALDAELLHRWQGGDPPAAPVGLRRAGQ